MQRQIAMVLVLLVGVGLAAPFVAPVETSQPKPEQAQTDDGYLQYAGSYYTYWFGDSLGQGLGVKLTPTAYPVRVDTLTFYFANAANNIKWRARVWDDDGTSGAPGTLLFDSVIRGQLNRWNGVNIASRDLRITSGSFYVFMYWDTMDFSGPNGWPQPFLGLDNGMTANVNFESYLSGTGGHTVWPFVGYWDLMIRAYVVDMLNDVGVTRILTPSGTIDSTASVTPACSVHNFGRTTQTSYNVQMRIGSTYTQTVAVANHIGGTTRYVEFPGWTAGPRGSYAVTCSTLLATDQATANDAQTGSIEVVVHDAAVLSINAPSGTVDSGAVVVPNASIANYGSVNEAFDVVCDVGTWSDTQTVSIHAGAQQTVDFASWTALARGDNPVAVRAELATDMVTANDDQSGSVTVDVHDAAAVAIVAPGGTMEPDPVVPQATVRNNGTLREACSVTFTIDCDPAYSQTLSLTDGLPSTDTTLDFPSWDAQPGSYSVGCKTVLTTDQVPTNDSVGGTVTVELGLSPGWDELAAMPMTPSGKAAKDGGWLAYGAGDEYIYASKGYKSGDFYAFDIGAGAWTTLPGWPLGAEAKGPYKGSAGCSDGNGNIYATKGNNTPGFWKYAADSAGGTWVQLTDVPLGLSNKKVKGGTDMVYVPSDSGDYVYLLKGYKCEFYRFDVVAGTWEALEDAPTGVKNKWDKGSWLAYDEPNRKIYAHKAKYHELYAYDLGTRTWGTLLPGMPQLCSQTGKTKKSKDGGSAAILDGVLYALKGGNTQDFYCLDLGTMTWAEKETVPAFGTTGKKKRVKAGADIVTDGELLYALKGNKTLEFWRYVVGTPQAGARPGRSGALAGVTAPAVRLRVGPNPASDRLVVEYALPRAAAASVRVTDITGRLVVVRELAAGLSGSVQLELPGLARGVYLVQFSSEGFRETAKLVVNH